MPDLTMCVNDICPLRSKCYRYRAVPDDLRQSFSKFKPKTYRDEKHTTIRCLQFWEIERGRMVMDTEDVDKRYKRSKDESDNTGD